MSNINIADKRFHLTTAAHPKPVGQCEVATRSQKAANDTTNERKRRGVKQSTDVCKGLQSNF